MSKEKLLYTIGEVAEELCLEQHVLRFWETQFSQIKPTKRKGRRLYDHKCITTIKTIKHMLHDKGYTIKGANKELNKQLSNTKVNCDKEYLKDLLQEVVDLRDYLISKMSNAGDNKQE